MDRVYLKNFTQLLSQRRKHALRNPFTKSFVPHIRTNITHTAYVVPSYRYPIYLD